MLFDIVNTNTGAIHQRLPVNTLLHGDCIEKMHEMPGSGAHLRKQDRRKRRAPNLSNP
jgi:hypothetical protein